MKENKKGGEKGSSGTECCLSKVEKLAIPARVALLQSTDVWVGDLGTPVHCMNHRQGGSNIHKANDTGTVCAHGKAMIAISIILRSACTLHK